MFFININNPKDIHDKEHSFNDFVKKKILKMDFSITFREKKKYFCFVLVSKTWEMLSLKEQNVPESKINSSLSAFLETSVVWSCEYL